MSNRSYMEFDRRAIELRQTLTAGRPVAEIAQSWTIEQFLSGDHLQIGDIILYRRERDPLSRSVRWATGGLFSHAAMIYYAPRRDEGFEHYFIIESDQSGVDLTPLTHYLTDASVSIGVLRASRARSWIDADFLATMRGHMMETITGDYDYSTIRSIGRSILWSTLFGIGSTARGAEKTLAALRRRTPHLLPRSFICSGLIQLGYVAACIDAIKRGAVRPDAVRDAVYRKDILEWFDIDWSNYTDIGQRRVAEDLVDTFGDDLRATTPADLERSENLQWQFLATRGRVHTAHSLAEAAEQLSQPPRPHYRR